MVYSEEEIEEKKVESIYLENTTTRNAFYEVLILKEEESYRVVIKWGPIGQTGQQTRRSKYKTLDLARIGACTLVEKKKFRHYYEVNRAKNKKNDRFSLLKLKEKDKLFMERFSDFE